MNSNATTLASSTASTLAPSFEESKFIPVSYYRYNRKENTYDIKTYLSYEIRNYEPFEIRNSITKNILDGNFHHKTGYHQYTLNKDICLKHVILATMFIVNDDPLNKIQVNHKNHIRDDNSINNIEWCTVSKNTKDRTSFNKKYKVEYINNIPNDIIKITTYGEHKLADYYYYHNGELNKDYFYWYNGGIYRILRINKRITKRRNYEFVNVTDINNKSVDIFISKFKKLYNIYN